MTSLKHLGKRSSKLSGSGRHTRTSPPTGHENTKALEQVSGKRLSILFHWLMSCAEHLAATGSLGIEKVKAAASATSHCGVVWNFSPDSAIFSTASSKPSDDTSKA
jgi:hypothetical protein